MVHGVQIPDGGQEIARGSTHVRPPLMSVDLRVQNAAAVENGSRVARAVPVGGVEDGGGA